jgi:hypothetical protein
VQIAGNSFPVEAVGPISTTSGSYIVFRLPDLMAGTYPLSIRVRGVNSTNSPDLIIMGFGFVSNSGSARNFDKSLFTELLFSRLGVLF